MKDFESAPWTTQEKNAIVQQSFEPGMTVSLVGRQHGVAASQLFLCCKQYQEGRLTAVAAGEQGVPASWACCRREADKRIFNRWGGSALRVFRNLGGDFHARGLITRRLSSSNPARPYICRFSIFRRFTWLSTTRLLHLLIMASHIAAASVSIPADTRWSSVKSVSLTRVNHLLSCSLFLIFRIW